MGDNVEKNIDEEKVLLFCEEHKINIYEQNKINILMSFLDDLPKELRDDKTEALITKTFLGNK